VGVQQATTTATGKMSDIGTIIARINDFVTGIAGAMEEQAATTRDIAANVGQAAVGIQEVNRNVTRSSPLTAQMAEEIAEVNTAVDGMSHSNAQINQNAEELSHLAGQLKELGGRFTV